MTTLARSASSPGVLPLDPLRLRTAKRAYTTKHVDLEAACALLGAAAPRAGDLVLATVAERGQHERLELPDGRKATLFAGDEVVVAYGHRYAPDQFEAEIPGDLGPCSLVAGGGLAARVLAAHGRMRQATALHPVGLLLDRSGSRLALTRRGTPPARRRPARRPVTVAVTGASMNAGKTTAAAHLVRGLRRAGLRVGAAKVTGTGSGGDVWLLEDAGACPVYDFTHAGLPSTYQAPIEEVVGVFTDLTDRLAEDGCEVVVLEVADGVYQRETAALLTDPCFAERVDGVLFAACDALGATAGAGWLRSHGQEPFALGGVLSSSPLATREAVAATGLPVWSLAELADAGRARDLVDRLRHHRAAVPRTLPEPVVEQTLAEHHDTGRLPLPGGSRAHAAAAAPGRVGMA